MAETNRECFERILSEFLDSKELYILSKVDQAVYGGGGPRVIRFMCMRDSRSEMMSTLWKKGLDTIIPSSHDPALEDFKSIASMAMDKGYGVSRKRNSYRIHIKGNRYYLYHPTSGLGSGIGCQWLRNVGGMNGLAPVPFQEGVTDKQYLEFIEDYNDFVPVALEAYKRIEDLQNSIREDKEKVAMLSRIRITTRKALEEQD